MNMAPSESKAEREKREADEAAAAAVAQAAAGSDVGTDDKKSGGKVKVDQPDGEVTFSRGGEVVMTKTVKDGHVTAADDAELAVLLGSMPGAVLVD